MPSQKSSNQKDASTFEMWHFPPKLTDGDEIFQTVIDGVRSKAGDELAQQTIQHIKTEFSTLDWILEGMMARSGLKIPEKGKQGFLSANALRFIPSHNNEVILIFCSFRH